MSDEVESSTPAAPRRVVGKPWPKGVSGNPGGRPKGVAAYIREQTKDCQELVDRLIKVARGETGASQRDQNEAMKILLERGLGRPTETVLTGEIGTPAADALLEQLTPEDVTALARQAKAKAA